MIDLSDINIKYLHWPSLQTLTYAYYLTYPYSKYLDEISLDVRMYEGLVVIVYFSKYSKLIRLSFPSSQFFNINVHSVKINFFVYYIIIEEGNNRQLSIILPIRYIFNVW